VESSKKAALEVRRNINILKLVYDNAQDAPFDFGIESPFDYEYIVDGKRSGGHYINRHRRTIFSRIDVFDQMVTDITNMRINKHTSEIEKGVLNAIDIFGLSDSATALEIRFLVCVTALEGLLLSKDDKDYLGWKLSEKVAFLVGDTREWIATFYNIPLKDRVTTLTDDYINQERVSARKALYRCMKKLYSKRSGFTHGNLESDKEKRITINDYDMISSILIEIIKKLTQLHKNGRIKHIASRSEEDKSSLDHHIEELRYS
jgi:hypothetical protein